MGATSGRPERRSTIQQTANSSGEHLTSTIRIEAPPARVLEVLCDFQAYAEWTGFVDSVTVLSLDEDGRPRDVEFVVKPGPLPTARYVLRYSYPDDGLVWEYVRGVLRDCAGSYALASEESGTRVEYELDIDPGRIPVPGFVKRRAIQLIQKVALNDLKRRVEGDAAASG